MRVISRNTMSVLSVTLGMGFVCLLLVPLLQAQEYPADTTRGKAVYARHCQSLPRCRRLGGWTGREGSQGGTSQFSPFLLFSEIRR